MSDDTAALQSLLDNPPSGSSVVELPKGSYNISSPGLVVPSGVSLRMDPAAVVRYTGTGTAITFVESRGAEHQIQVAKASNKWYGGGESTSVGVEVGPGSWQSDFLVRSVAGFGTGLWLNGDSGPVAYNTFRYYLQDNKTNLKLSRVPPGHANQNTFIGGQMRHTSSSLNGGTAPVAGTVGIDNDCNGNTWVSPSLEGAVTETTILNTGASNAWYNPRLEQARLVKMAASGGAMPNNANFNVIHFGYGFHAGNGLSIEDEGDANSFSTHYGSRLWSHPQFGEGSALTLASQTSSGGHHALRVVDGDSNGSSGTVRAVVTRDGRVGMLDSGGVMRYLVQPSGPGPAVWE